MDEEARTKVVEGVAISSGKREGSGKEAEEAMRKAVEHCYAEGITDTEIIKQRMREAYLRVRPRVDPPAPYVPPEPPKE